MKNSVAGVTRWSWRLAVAGAALFVLGPAAAHFGTLPAMSGFLAFGVGGVLGVLATVLALAAVAGQAGATRRTGWQALAIGGIVVAIFAWTATAAGGLPRINDITTDTENPPPFVAATSDPANRGRDMSYPGHSFAEQQRAGYPDLRPLRLAAAPAGAFACAQATAAGMPGWEMRRMDAEAHVLEGTATSWLFRFRDDFVIEIRPEGSGSVVHMRSKSRDGKGDVGANAARIAAFFEKLRDC